MKNSLSPEGSQPAHSPGLKHPQGYYKQSILGSTWHPEVALVAFHHHLPKEEQLLDRNVQWFRGGLVFKAHRLVYHSTLDLRVIKKKKERIHSSFESLRKNDSLRGGDIWQPRVYQRSRSLAQTT